MNESDAFPHFHYPKLPPLGTREEFMAQLQGVVTENAPGLFALCEEIGDRHDAVIHYWGMAHEDRTDLIGTEGTLHLGFRDAATARQRLACRRTLHLVWA
ncbi:MULTISPECIES: hypothetical protein [unclassified Actinopolyspora]|uniref:hypothetical protein n=1 Tax=Actinopolyspora TaxID=1849 RepID=UPI0013F5E192|nr:hypothetical protein [Actinopolyspora sp. BKK2]NHE76665.1 hypothetical protein [Actinopolyspora sp. BKK1]